MGKNKLVRPFLKWAGGKRQLVPLITENYLPKKYNVYYEPFLGGGALFLELQRSKAVVNDSNSELINCYEVIRDSLEDLMDELSQHRNEEDYYYQVREWDRYENHKSRSPVERAARIIFLNKTCYNGLFRVNSQGHFNVPFGRYKNPNFLDQAVLKAVNKYLQNSRIEFLNLDFEKSVESAEKGDFIYFDPPYDPVSDTASFTGYDVNGFDKQEQVRLKSIVDDLTRRGCKVLLSNACTDFILDLYKNYAVAKVSVPRAINSNALKRGRVEEVLVMNYEPKKTGKI